MVFLTMMLMMMIWLLVLYWFFLMLVMSISPPTAMLLPLHLLSATGVGEDDDLVADVEGAPLLDEVPLSLPDGQSGGSPGSDSVVVCRSSLEQERKKKMMMLVEPWLEWLERPCWR
jgi:hypothetical protein